jgi:hypothetical protein
MGAVGSLVLYRRVPPAVEVNDMLRLGEVQAGAARLEAENKERRPILALELFNERAAVLSRPERPKTAVR